VTPPLKLRIAAATAGIFTLVQLFMVGKTGPAWLIRPWTGLFLLSILMAAESVFKARSLGKEPWTTGALFWGLAAVYLSTFRWHGSDDLPTSLLPFAILRQGSLTLDHFAAWFSGYQHTAVVKAHGHLASFYPLPGAILSLPVYLPAVLAGAEPSDHVLHQLSKCSAVLISAAGATVFFLIFRRNTRLPQAFSLAVVAGLGTNFFSTTSQGLWQHGPSALILLAAVLAAEEAPRRPSLWAWAGALAALSTTARTTNVFFSIAFCFMAFWKGKKKGILLFSAGAAVPTLLTVLYWGTFLHGLPADIGYNKGLMSFPPRLTALAGFLASPQRGALLFSPIIAFGWRGLIRSLKTEQAWMAMPLAAAALGNYILFSCFQVWTGAFSFGPRYLFEAMTMVLVFLPAGTEDMKGMSWWRMAAAASILIHALGGYSRWQWEKHTWPHPWDPRSHPLVYTVGKILRGDDFTRPLRPL
jgi:hypothetical protein